MLARRPGKESSINTQNSSALKPPPEVKEEGSSEGAATEEASQDSREPTFLEGFRRLMNQTKTKEVAEEGSSEGGTTDKASHDSRKPTFFEDFLRLTDPLRPKEVHKEGSSKGTATIKASQDDSRPVHFEKYRRIKNQSKTKAWATAAVNEKYRQLFRATVKGDWKVVQTFLNDDYEAMVAEVMTKQDKSLTVLDVAVMAGQDQVVENLVKDLPLNYDYMIRRALSTAARRGRIKMVKALVGRVGGSPESVDLALWHAISNAPMQKEVIWYLASRAFSAPTYANMSTLIMAGHLDIVLYLFCRFPEISKDDAFLGLMKDLVKMKSCFRSAAKLNFWEKSIDKIFRIPICLLNTSLDNSKEEKMAPGEHFKKLLWKLATKLAPFIKKIGELQLRHKCSLEFADLTFYLKGLDVETPKILEYVLTSGIVLDAASHGIFEIVKFFLELYPELMWDDNFPGELIKEVVNGRHVELFRLVNAYHRIPKVSNDIFTNGDLMEAIVKWSPRYVSADVSGAAFLMQRELQWYKVLQDRSDPSFKSMKFEVKKDLKLEQTEERTGKTYWEIFVEQHQDLLKEAGQWMKDTSSSCSLVATLIITIAFAVAFTVPGGNDGSTGIPIFLNKDSFMVFAVADALALFSSVTATLMFLAILTSRYAIEDFRHSLPRKMILGLTFLFLSLAFMLVAFGSALTIVLSERLKWIYIPITLMAALPVVLFAILQLPLYVEMVESTYRPRLYRPLNL